MKKCLQEYINFRCAAFTVGSSNTRIKHIYVHLYIHESLKFIPFISSQYSKEERVLSFIKTLPEPLLCVEHLVTIY